MSTSTDFNFPYQPYDIQQSFMESLYLVLSNDKIGIFESPTGTGKSLSLLCATLKFLKDQAIKTKSELQSAIDSLSQDILLSIDKSDDWIEEQYQLIKKKNQLLELEEKLKNINEYDQKIQDIRRNVVEKEKRFVKKQEALEENFDDINVDSDRNIDINEEFLLPDVESDSDEDEALAEKEGSFRPLQVFFCSRTHSQLSQLVGEVKSTIYSRDIRSVSLGSRQNYCINSSVKKLRKSNLINETCLDLQKSKCKNTKKDEEKKVVKSQKLSHKSCPYFGKNIEKLRNLSLSKVMDIEELVKVGMKEKSCPYYSSRSAVQHSQLVFVPYQILFNRMTREQCGIKLKGSIVVIDEAHNLMDTISQIHTASLTLESLKTCHTQLINYKMKYMKRFSSKNLLKFNQLIFITKQLSKFLQKHEKSTKAFELHEVLSDSSIYNINLVDILNFCEKTRFAQKIHGFSKVYLKLQEEQQEAAELRKNATKNLLVELQEKQLTKKGAKSLKILPKNQETILEIQDNITNVIRPVIQFIECLLQRHNGGKILVTYEENTKETSMKFLLLDPSSPFEEIITDCRSIVLAGGTMKPTEELTEQLFKNCRDRVEVHSFGHVVPRKSILPIALSHGSSGKEFLFTHVNKENEIMISEAATTIVNICRIVPGGVVCFFTSYDNLNRFVTFINNKKIIESIKTRKDVFVESRDSSKTEKMLDDYSKSIKQKISEKTGAIIFSVIGGKLSEGMNFSDDLGRCIIVVGLPFPNKSSPDLIEKMNFISKNLNSSAGSEYYENLCMKAVNQSIGRSIRHIGDYATVLLLDSRYHRQNIVQKLPDWIKLNLITANAYGKVHCEIAKFFKEHEN